MTSAMQNAMVDKYNNVRFSFAQQMSKMEALVPPDLRWPCLKRLPASDWHGHSSRTTNHTRHGGSQMGEDLFMHKYFFSGGEWDCKNKTTIQNRGCEEHWPTYMELGANDGLAMSNSLFFERKLGWHGVLIEAIPRYCQSLVAHRCENNVVACGAVCTAEMSGKGNLTLLDAGAASGSAAMGTSALHLAMYEKGANKKKYVSVPCAPLSAMLANAGVQRIDLLSLDVEMQEKGVLETVDFQAVRFGVLLIEAPCKDELSDAAIVGPLLESHGYSYVARHGGMNAKLM